MLVNREKIQALKPCSDRFNNFLEHYPGFSGNMIDFLKLENITYSDKVWVFTKLLDKDTLVRWSIACAESVKCNYDNKIDDKALDNVFETLKSIKNFNNMSEEELSAARSAELAAELVESVAELVARSAESAAWSARSAARVAAWSAEAAARSAARSAEAAARSAVWSAAESARSAELVESVAELVAELKQEQKNIELLIEILKNKGI